MTVLATPANMRKYQRPARTIPQPNGETITVLELQPLVYSPETDEQYSATAGDYWNQPDDEPLKDSEGEPMILVFKRTTYVDADDVLV